MNCILAGRWGEKGLSLGVMLIHSSERECDSSFAALIKTLTRRRNSFPMLQNSPQQIWRVLAARGVLKMGCHEEMRRKAALAALLVKHGSLGSCGAKRRLVLPSEQQQ